MASSDTLVRDSRVLSRRVADGFLLLGPGDQAPTRVAGACARVWDVLEVGHTKAEIVALAADESGSANDQVVALVGESLDLLKRFISAEPSTSGPSL